MTKPKILVTCDLDSTICDTGHRHHLINSEDQGRGTDWNAYSLACDGDSPVMGMVRVLQLLALNADILIVGLSARMSAAEAKTLTWMENNGVPITKVFLDNGEPLDYGTGFFHADYKLARLRQVEEELGMKVSLHFDDYAEVAEKFNANGIPTVCVRTPQEITEIVETKAGLRSLA